MKDRKTAAAFIKGISIIIAFILLGLLTGNTALKYKSFERTVSVKGLSERDYPADIVIWPVQFSEAGNSSSDLYDSIEIKTRMIINFLTANGIAPEEITVSPPSITDKSAREYGDNSRADFRYTSTQTVTVYTDKIESVRKLMNSLSELGKQGIVFTGNNWQTEYIFNRLNEVKPDMIEEATANAREAALKFAADSESRLGKIKTANQGQFSISPRDNNNPHIKTVRVVSTIEYYLSD